MPPATRRTATPISRTALAREKGVSQGAVTKACRAGGPLAAAVLEGGHVDAAHPATVQWLGSGKRRAPDPLPAAAPAAGAAGAELVDPAELLALTFEEARRRYNVTLTDWVGARKAIAATEKINLENECRSGRLISREFVRTYMFGALDTLARLLLHDFIETSTSRLRSHFAAGDSLEAAHELQADLISQHLRRARHDMTRYMLAAVGTGVGAQAVTPPKPQPPPPAIAPALHRALEAQLAALAPHLVEHVARVFARFAAGKPFSNQIFDEALALLPEVQAAAVDSIRSRLRGAVDDAVTSHARTMRDATEVPDADPE